MLQSVIEWKSSGISIFLRVGYDMGITAGDQITIDLDLHLAF